FRGEAEIRSQHRQLAHQAVMAVMDETGVKGFPPTRGFPGDGINARHQQQYHQQKKKPLDLGHPAPSSLHGARPLQGAPATCVHYSSCPLGGRSYMEGPEVSCLFYSRPARNTTCSSSRTSAMPIKRPLLHTSCRATGKPP